MELKYTLAIADLTAFNEHFLVVTGLPGLRRQAFANALTTFGIVALFLYLYERNLPVALMVATVVGAVVGIAWPSVRRSEVKKAIPKALATLHDKQDDVIGPHVVKIDSEGFVDQTVASEVRQFWTGIREVHVTDGYLYLFTRPGFAYIVPRQAVPNLEEMLQMLAGYLGESAIRRFEQHAA